MMNSPKSIWSDMPPSAGIATLVCYAGVFGDVIAVEEVASRLGVAGRDEFYATLRELHLEGRLILKDGFVALPDLGDKIPVKISKIATAKDIISSKLKCLKSLGRNPLIKFVGVSGSIAANNPTRDRDDKLDIDVFLITRNQGLWLYNILKGLGNLLPRRKTELLLCLNYIIDESDLLIANRNFYTATEIRNLVPISGLDTYRKFLQVNNWVDYYYPGTSGTFSPLALAPPAHRINKFFYVVYNALRDIKWCLRPDPHKNIPAHRGIDFNLLGPVCGGYQAMVQKKFSRLAEKWFPELVGTELISKLFSDELSAEIKSGDLNLPEIIAHVGLGYDYSKYGQ